MGKVWVLDTETKGTGANIVPLEKTLKRSEAKPAPAKRTRPPAANKPSPVAPRTRRRAPERSASALPPGHVRKKATGELGRVKAVDAKAGTATVHWLRTGATSTVRLSDLARR